MFDWQECFWTNKAGPLLLCLISCSFFQTYVSWHYGLVLEIVDDGGEYEEWGQW